MEKQRDFFEQGPMALTPMTMKDIAQVLDRNESTISRAINNKYIDTPQGLFPMKFFFSQGVCNKPSTEDGPNDGAMNVSNRSIKEEIKDLIEQEDKTHPLSDQEIQNHFEKKNMKIARRTISKYRQALNILPSHLRKE
jgi:RNA polymerase sigma-54 factor